VLSGKNKTVKLLSNPLRRGTRRIIIAFDMKKKKKTINKQKNYYFLTAIFSLLIVLSALWFVGFHSGVRGPVSFQITNGATVGGIASQLKGKGWISSADTFKVMVMGFGGRVQAGEYDLPRGASTWRIARMFATGDIASTTIIIPEGLTVRQIVGVLNENKFLKGEALKVEIKEGELFPDTYTVAKGTQRAAVIKLMRDKMQDIQRGWEASGRHAPKPLKNWNEVITLASIVQKETPKKEEMPTVASVYLNRLRVNMRLQADPTVVYAITNRMGDMEGKALLTEHLQVEHPFNTYRNYGLPPAPIANVGREAIAAVLNPEKTDYLFFVADGTGGHNFSVDYEGHKENREKWREIKKNRK